MVEAEIDIIVAIIALISSGFTAIITIILTKQNNVKLRQLENELQTKRDEESAIREYEYDARKRLYQEYEPLLFQFNELADNALRRIIALARESRGGKLEKDISWLSGSGYYFDSTIYRLLIPFAIFNLMQKKLTMFDLKLNPLFLISNIY